MMQLKDLVALGWKDTSTHGTPILVRGFNDRDLRPRTVWIIFHLDDCFTVEVLHAEGSDWDEERWIRVTFPTLELALNAANALACVTPENPQGRWV